MAKLKQYWLPSTAAQKLWDKWDWVASFLFWDKTILAAAVGLVAWSQFFKWVKANLKHCVGPFFFSFLFAPQRKGMKQKRKLTTPPPAWSGLQVPSRVALQQCPHPQTTLRGYKGRENRTSPGHFSSHFFCRCFTLSPVSDPSLRCPVPLFQQGS